MTSTSHQPAQILSGKEIISRQLANCSLSYAGDASRWRNKNALVPESQNTSIWITRLPAGVTYKELLGGIRNTGRVWSSFINKPEHHKGIHTAAAKVVFFEALAAQRFLAQCNGPDGTGLVIRGHKATSEAQTYSFLSTPPYATLPSRVLIIAGPPLVVHPPSLLRYFAARFFFWVDLIVPVVEAENLNIYEWRFGSFSCQAESAFMAVSRDVFFQQAGVTVAFGIDPCERFSI
ncbi:hypothetical protein QBC39DRAFT_261436 [Podospora conica]|nr:hypothetical protein QBC39DRAFT_261436 [Schizothecium conicum]